MRIIGITGSIACGKSTVSRHLIRKGFPVIDGDLLARQLTVSGGEAMGDIRSAFGNDYILPDGSMNRQAMGQLVFSDPRAREKLDRVLAPYLRAAVTESIEQLRMQGVRLCFLDMPLLFEKGYDKLCDTVWTVWVPEDVQLDRLILRDGYSAGEALNRIRSVLSSDEKASLSDRIIDNSGSVERTMGIVSDLLSEELSSGRQASSRRRRSCPPDLQSSPEPVSQTYAPSPPVPDAYPEGFRRPDTATRSRREPRKAAWSMPVWLKTSLIAAAAVLAVGITALLLMNAYLRRCDETHIAEQRAIDRQYPIAYRELIETYSSEYNLSPAYVSAIIRNESSFRADAESGAGARGLMQLMPDTADWIAGKLQVSGL